MSAPWLMEDDALSFSAEEQRVVDRVKRLLEVRMRDARRRHAHSLGVARTAASLACVYGEDVTRAYIAGLIHDWDKVLPDDELLARALSYRIPIAGDPARAVPLLHGPVAARELPELFPELPTEIFQAVERHTVAARDMTGLDMVVFIADAIEPNRRGAYADELREQVGELELEDLFLTCYAGGLAYVLETRRYLYPDAVGIYNSYVTKQQKGSA